MSDMTNFGHKPVFPRHDAEGGSVIQLFLLCVTDSMIRLGQNGLISRKSGWSLVQKFLSSFEF